MSAGEIVQDEHTLESYAKTGRNTQYIQAAASDNTRAAYRSDIKKFLEEGGKLPTNPDAILRYLERAALLFNPRTIQRKLTAIRQWHVLKGHVDPTDNEVVRKIMKGISRIHGKPKKQAKALRLADLDRIIRSLKESSSRRAIRNRALVLLGFYGALRRSELVNVKWEDVQFVNEGIIVTIPKSKTDQAGEGAHCVIPFGNKERCPVHALIDWRQESGIYDGYIFRRLSKTGTVLGGRALTGRYINSLIVELAKDAGLLDPEAYSSHSLRRGFATEASRLGAPMPAIQRHGRWKSINTVLSYIDAGRSFEDSAVNVLFDN